MSRGDHIAAWMRRRLVEAGARGFVVGLSGGVDSAVVLRLAQLAAPGAALGVLLPCHSDPQDESDAMLVAKHLAAPTIRIDLSKTYDALVAPMRTALKNMPAQIHPTTPADPIRGRTSLANIKPRLRMTALYFVANSLNYLVIGTGNRSEIAVGYFTKHGDGGADLLPLGKLGKDEVRALARELGLPASIVDRVPSAGLWLGQTDEEEIGFTYADLERYLENGAQDVAPALAVKIERLMRSSEHKRQLPPMPDFE